VSALWQLDPGGRVWEAATYYDDGDNPIAREGPSSYERSERAAEAFALAALRGRRSEQLGGFWYATLRRGRVVDPIGEGHPHDRSFEPDADWSRTLLAEDNQ
jgi:hypothetical protein